MKLYTRTGDDGTTGLFGGGRVPKSHPRIEAYGTVDETNAAIGLACSLLTDSPSDQQAKTWLEKLQNDLFVLGGDLASPGPQKYPVPRIDPSHVEEAEALIDRLDADIPPLKHFILPGGTPAGAALHMARTVSRRAERHMVELAAMDEEISEAALHFINRVSDLLFAMARWVNHSADVPETAWIPVDREALKKSP